MNTDSFDKNVVSRVNFGHDCIHELDLNQRFVIERKKLLNMFIFVERSGRFLKLGRA